MLASTGPEHIGDPGRGPVRPDYGDRPEVKNRQDLSAGRRRMTGMERPVNRHEGEIPAHVKTTSGTPLG
jgi:hypothetical protein